jgi:hypothetical protein
MDTYKEKLLHEIQLIPDDMGYQFYQVFHALSEALLTRREREKQRCSLAGIWAGSEIDDNLFDSARKSVFSYEDGKAS